ncbi:hypothetical protein HED60_22605 [Planctomycetales bacterium ZRK34]|nr:hypothetical protein HED60_22605 [Planctomycetales bacterium ZRK34]
MTIGTLKWGLLGLCIVIWSGAGAAGAETLTPSQQLAQRMARLARQTLAGQQEPGPEQVAQARKLLDQAVALDRSNVELAALRAEAASLDAGADPEARRKALAGYLRVNPSDDAAQLRLIGLLADAAQDVPARAELYQRMLTGPAAEQLSAPLRSRVAVQAAVLAREQGHTREFAQLIQQALRLDTTNARATAEAYLLLRDRGASLLDQAQALLALLSADPTNATVHLQVASMLLHAGAYEQSIGWFESASSLWRYTGAPEDAALVGALNEWATALIGAGRYDDAAALVDSIRAGDPDAALPVSLMSVLVAAHDLSGKSEAADRAFEKMIQRLDEAAGQAPDNMDRRVDNVWARLLYNRQIDKLDEPFKQLNTGMKADDPVLKRLTGWRLMRQGKSEEAAKVLEPLVKSDPAAALAMAMNKARADDSDRLAQYNQVYRSAPGNMVGVLAAYHIRKLGGRPQLTDESQTIQRLAQQVPDSLRRITVEPDAFIKFELESIGGRVAYGQPVQLRLSLTNTSPIALSVGPGATIPGTALIIVTASAPDGKPRPTQPLVVNLARRLRLNPGQSIKAHLMIDAPVFAIAPNQSLIIRNVAILNPVLTPQGQYQPGLMGVVSRTQTVMRPGIDITDKAMAERLASLKSEPDCGTLAALPILAVMMPEQGQKIITDLNAVYGKLDAARRAWLISCLPLPSKAASDSPFAELLKAADADKDPLVQNVRKAQSPPDTDK